MVMMMMTVMKTLIPTMLAALLTSENFLINGIINLNFIFKLNGIELIDCTILGPVVQSIIIPPAYEVYQRGI